MYKRASKIKQEFKYLGREIRLFQSSLNPPPIHNVPEKILVSIFRYMDTNELVKCRSTCKRWKGVIKQRGSLWGYNVTLKGNLKKIEKRWSHIQGLLGQSKVYSLNLRLEDGRHSPAWDLGEQRNWRSSSLEWAFPFETLEVLDYTSWSADIDCQVWRLVNRCEKLKVLRWVGLSDKVPVESTSSCYTTKDSLRQCRLKEFKFKMNYDYRMDDGFVQLLGQAISIEICGLPCTRFNADILRACSKTLVKFRFDNDSFCSSFGDASHDPIHLERLEIFEAYEHCFKGIFAPSLRVLAIGTLGWNSSDANIMESCTESLEEVKLTVDKDTVVRVSDLLLNLPKCVKLHLYLHEEPHDTPFPLWEMYHRDNKEAWSTTIRDILPKLEHLSISFDNSLTGAELVMFMQAREYVGLSRIKSLSIEDCIGLRSSARDWLEDYTHCSEDMYAHSDCDDGCICGNCQEDEEDSE